jgi:hypothetical protein
LPGKTAATDAQISVTTLKATITFTVDQNVNTGQWNLLGTFLDPVSVKVTDKANGPVIIDAVKFEKVGTKEEVFSEK